MTTTPRFRLRELLDQKGVTQTALFRRSGVSLTIINRIVNNRAGQASLKTLGRLADALGVEPGELIVRGPDATRGRRRSN